MRKTDDISRRVSNPTQELAIGIVIGAIADWRYFVKHPDKQTLRYNFDELRWFFNSQWCEFLLESTEASPKKILEILEGELNDSRLREPH